MAFLGSETAAVVATVALLSHDTFVHYYSRVVNANSRSERGSFYGSWQGYFGLLSSYHPEHENQWIFFIEGFDSPGF